MVGRPNPKQRTLTKGDTQEAHKRYRGNRDPPPPPNPELENPPPAAEKKTRSSRRADSQKTNINETA